MRVLPSCSIAVGIIGLLSGCGAVTDDTSHASAPASSVAIRCQGTPHAPLEQIEGVADGSVRLNACGDVLYGKPDESVWIRLGSDGTETKLADHGSVGDPPEEAPMGGLSLERAWFTLSPSGALTKFDPIQIALGGIFEVCPTLLAAIRIETGVHTLSVVDRVTGEVRQVASGYFLSSVETLAPAPTGVLAVYGAPNASAREVSLWHGVP